MDLDSLKYSELQKLAKNAGIKANMKVEKLVKALKEHFGNQEQSNKSTTSRNKNEQSGSCSSGTEDQSSAADTEGDDTKDGAKKKKATTRGKKKGQRKGTRGKNKTNSSSEDSENLEDIEKPLTPKLNTPSSKVSASSPQVKSAAKLTLSAKKTSQPTTPNVRKTPTIVKPVSANSLKARTSGAKKTPIVQRGASRTSNPRSSKNATPEVLSQKPSSASGSANFKNAASNSTKASDNGKLKQAKKFTPSGVTIDRMTTPKSGGTKRASPRNNSAKGNPPKGKNNTTPAKTGHKRKRQDTFELEGPTLSSTDTPEADRTTKQARSSVGVAEQAKLATTSPDVKDMIDSMSGAASSAERRNRLMSVINKKVEGKVKSSPQTGPVTQIPRFVAFLAKKKQEQKKPVTPGNKDWEKVHKKEFSKFDSIDVYLEKKRKRAEEMTASVKKARTVLHEVQEAVSKLKSKRTPSLGKNKTAQIFKPSVMSTKDMNLNFGATSKKTPDTKKAPAPFKPSVTSTKNMNLNFSSLKTPPNRRDTTEPTLLSSRAKDAQSARKSIGANASARKSIGANAMSARKSVGTSAARKSLSTTPFHFTGNLNTSVATKSTSKPAFDLKASLARPITWKPHTGKLKPLQEMYSGKGAGTENSASRPTTSHMDIFKSTMKKSSKTYSRHDRRAAVAAKRMEAKNSLQMKRRGIVVSP